MRTTIHPVMKHLTMAALVSAVVMTISGCCSSHCKSCHCMDHKMAPEAKMMPAK